MSADTSQLHVRCNLCGGDEYTVLFGPGVAQVNQIVRCRCGLMYANPRRPADHVDIQTWPDDPSFDYERERPQRFEKERLQVRDLAATRALLRELHPKRGRLVEVGSSLGFLLQVFHEDGWEVLGVEPDKNGVRNTRKLGLEARCAILEDAALPDCSADVVVMLHVIEHLPDPVGTLREVFRVLRPGGHLVLETPRYDTLSFRILGRRERSISCEGHIYFFTRDTLRRTWERAGFELVRREAAPRTLTVDRLLHNVAVITRGASFQRAAAKLSRRLGLNRLSLRVDIGDAQRVVLRRPLEQGERTRSVG